MLQAKGNGNLLVVFLFKIDILLPKLYNKFVVFVAKKRRIADKRTKEKENG